MAKKHGQPLSNKSPEFVNLDIWQQLPSNLNFLSNKQVPNGKFDASIYVPNKDIGFVKIGQKAKVRIDAYPSSRYGELNGEVSLIGADVLPPDNTSNSYRFPINLTLDKSWLMAGEIKIPLRAGMSITSNLKIR